MQERKAVSKAKGWQARMRRLAGNQEREGEPAWIATRKQVRRHAQDVTQAGMPSHAKQLGMRRKEGRYVQKFSPAGMQRYLDR
jgi:hypothetical protein